MTYKTDPANDYASYLIRFWREPQEGNSTLWRAQVESIQTGQSWQFSDLGTLIAFLQESFPQRGRLQEQ